MVILHLDALESESTRSSTSMNNRILPLPPLEFILKYFVLYNNTLRNSIKGLGAVNPDLL